MKIKFLKRDDVVITCSEHMESACCAGIKVV